MLSEAELDQRVASLVGLGKTCIEFAAAILRNASVGRVRNFYEIDFCVHADQRGRLTVIEGATHLPFVIQRVYYMTDFAPQAIRGLHAHRQLEQVIVAIRGSFDVFLDDGRNECVQRLNRSDKGLYIGTYIWHEISNCSADAVCMMLASMPYDEEDYIRDHEKFRAEAKGAT